MPGSVVLSLHAVQGSARLQTTLPSSHRARRESASIWSRCRCGSGSVRSCCRCGVWPCEPVTMSEAPAVRFRVFTLNCWGIRYLSKCCRERYEMIAQLLSQERYDVVLLQEVWSEQDYHFLRSKLTSTHPYSVYFRRCLEPWIITAVLCCVSTQGCEGGCTLLSQNCFASVGDTQSFPSGIRIDYILYKGSGGFPVKCEHLMTTNGIPPGRNMPYSDHEAVCATLNVQKDENAVSELRHVEGSKLIDNGNCTKGCIITLERKSILRTGEKNIFLQEERRE
ncbi:hypothetical protein chiPu_0016932 [Chiloscyllium punctatum]|uniref:sphingomyelin phosphodiesterase n=1 Tax=Chiloscyllium punctatum TaxID=137246 RepID=A0A401T6Z7_CHIPU|nr:hypothetical protein [Chiloscyllium punctatum]